MVILNYLCPYSPYRIVDNSFKLFNQWVLLKSNLNQSENGLQLTLTSILKVASKKRERTGKFISGLKNGLNKNYDKVSDNFVLCAFYF